MHNLDCDALHLAARKRYGNWIDMSDFIAEENFDLRGFFQWCLQDDLKNYLYLEQIGESVYPPAEWEALMQEKMHIFTLQRQSLDAHWDAYWNKQLIDHTAHEKLVKDTHDFYRGRYAKHVLSTIVDDSKENVRP